MVEIRWFLIFFINYCGFFIVRFIYRVFKFIVREIGKCKEIYEYLVDNKVFVIRVFRKIKIIEL